jgi:hypothetical protein
LTTSLEIMKIINIFNRPSNKHHSNNNNNNNNNTPTKYNTDL